MRWLIAWLFWTSVAFAQSSTVLPTDAELTVTVENAEVTPYTQEMILITIEGVYRRHITLEKLEQPDLSGFNWMQLGADFWYDDTEAGKKVKKFKRRMALYPDRAGEVEIGPFIHHLTLTDEGDDWFAHDIQSEPFTIKVEQAPAVPDGGWWFPVRRLEVGDNWSNSPDQLVEGEGVLRIIRVEAIGVGPDMIPPMPELKSPSAMIFPHPEKRIVELSPYGPVSVAFWRWTIRPTNTTSAILEPIEFDYFDTVNRVPRKAVISPQRLAYLESELDTPPVVAEPARLGSLPVMAVFGVGAVLGLVVMLMGRRFSPDAIRRWPMFDPLVRDLKRAERMGDGVALRRAAKALIRRDGAGRDRQARLSELDDLLFSEGYGGQVPEGFARRFLSAA